MQVGFTVIQRQGTADFQHNGLDTNSQHEITKITQFHANTVAFIGRLYYKSERISELHSRASDEWIRKCAENDALLVLLLYQEFGPKALERLEGDFALVLWDAATTQVIAMRDPMGGYPLYWTKHRDTVALSTGLEPLLAVRGDRTLSREYIAEFLMSSGPGEELATELCVYEGVHRILPGTMIFSDAATRAVRTHAYWDWLDHIQDPGTDCIDQMSASYADMLRTAVRERLHGRVAAQFSGGLDSTSIALLAADLMEAKSPENPLHTLSLVYDRLPQLARERSYIDKALQYNSSDIVAHLIPADDLLHYDVFRNVPFHDEPYSGLWSLQMELPMLAAAAEMKAATMLTGHGADEIHDVQPYYLADLLHRGRMFEAWQQAGRWAQARNSNRWEILKVFGFGALGKPWLSKIGWRKQAEIRSQDLYSVPPWISPSFAREFDLSRRGAHNQRRTYRRHPNTTLSVILEGLKSRSGDVLRWSLAAPLGIVTAHPFLDTRLLALGLGISLRLRPDPTRKKPVLADAMRDVLPREIRDRKMKGCFDEIYYLGLARNFSYLEAMVQTAPIEDLGIFDKKILASQLEEASLGGANCQQLHRLDLTISLVRWLCLQKETQNRSRSPAEVIKPWLNSSSRILEPQL